MKDFTEFKTERDFEQAVANAIGLGPHYNYFNGSGSCGYYLIDQAVQRLPDVLESARAPVSRAWMEKMREAARADRLDGQGYSLTNTWIVSRYAMQDAWERAHGSRGLNAAHLTQMHFFHPENREAWRRMEEGVKVFIGADGMCEIHTAD